MPGKKLIDRRADASNDHRELADLATRIREMRKMQGEEGALRREARQARHAHRAMAAGLSLAFRVFTEVVVALAFAIIAGRGIDMLFGTAPWGTLLMLPLGLAAGIRNVILAVSRFERQQSVRHDNSPPV